MQEAADDYEELLRTSKKKNKTVARRYKTLLQQLPDLQTAKDMVRVRVRVRIRVRIRVKPNPMLPTF